MKKLKPSNQVLLKNLSTTFHRLNNYELNDSDKTRKALNKKYNALTEEKNRRNASGLLTSKDTAEARKRRRNRLDY